MDEADYAPTFSNSKFNPEFFLSFLLELIFFKEYIKKNKSNTEQNVTPAVLAAPAGRVR